MFRTKPAKGVGNARELAKTPFCVLFQPNRYRWRDTATHRQIYRTTDRYAKKSNIKHSTIQIKTTVNNCGPSKR